MFTFMGINNNHLNQQFNDVRPQRRSSRSEDYTRQSQQPSPSTSSRTSSAAALSRWPADHPRLTRTSGTPAAGTMPSNPGTASGSSAFTSTSLKRETGYFDYQPNQQQQQAFPHSRPQTRSSGDGMDTRTTRSLNLSSTLATISSYSMPATSCMSPRWCSFYLA